MATEFLCVALSLLTVTTSAAECSAWCQKPPVPWDQKCGWSWCSGCAACPQEKQCAEWCPRPPISWNEKCKWGYCDACEPCSDLAPEPEPESEPDSPNPTPNPEPEPTPPSGPGASACREKCPVATGKWESDFKKFEGNNDFCNCGFGGSCGFICGGGVTGGSGGQCPAEACSSGQYLFEDDTWSIKVESSMAKGKSPYRAFAYMPVCMHQPTKKCSPDLDFTLAFSFRVTGLVDWGAYVKLLFWTDGGNLIGLIPPNSAKGKQAGFNKLKLVTFMSDDYPNVWDGETDIEDGKWYSVQVRFQGSSKVTITLGDETFATDKYAVNVWAEQNGPQLGVYHFDPGMGSYSTDGFVMDLAALSGPGGNLKRHECEHQCLEKYPGSETTRRRRSPQPTPAPTPEPSGPSFCCFHPKDCGSCQEKQGSDQWCGQTEGQCSTCAGLWCNR